MRAFRLRRPGRDRVRVDIDRFEIVLSVPRVEHDFRDTRFLTDFPLRCAR
jgi:hypothetical protein